MSHIRDLASSVVTELDRILAFVSFAFSRPISFAVPIGTLGASSQYSVLRFDSMSWTRPSLILVLLHS